MTGDSPTLVERILLACKGWPFADVPWPHRLLHDAAEELTLLKHQRDEALARLAEADAVIAASRRRKISDQPLEDDAELKLLKWRDAAIARHAARSKKGDG